MYTPARPLRSSLHPSILNIAAARTKSCGHRAFAYQAPINWNPGSIGIVERKETFKKTSKDSIVQQAGFHDIKVYHLGLGGKIMDVTFNAQKIYAEANGKEAEVRYGEWYNLPLYQSTAFAEGYHRHNDVCKTDNYHGFLFSKSGNTKAMPIYDLNGNLAGIQSAIPGNMKGFNSSNMTIDLPPEEIMPPLLKGLRDTKGILYYTVTAYFKHPKLICTPIAPKGVSSGRGLYIQMGFNPENDFFYVPRENQLLSQFWRRGHCAPLMGTHYFMNLSQNMPCEKLYPLFLMYDMEGSLGGFGWVFQGRPVNFYSEAGVTWFHLTPKPNNLYPFLFDPGMLPPCMFNEKFQVFGLHVYLQDPKRLLCTAVSNLRNAHTTVQLETPSKVQQPRTLVNSGKGKERQNKHSENYAIEAFDKRSSVVKIHSLNSLSIFIVISLVNFLYLKCTFH